MKKKYRAILLVIAMLVVCLSGCDATKDTNTPINIAIVSGYHANAPIPAIHAATIQDAIINSTSSYGSVCIVINDGAPYVVADYQISTPEKNLSSTKRKEIAQAQATQITAVLTDAQATTPEVDTLAAITLAVRSLSDTQGQKYIVIDDSGLSTCGYMNFTQNLLQADSQTIVDYLTATEALPKMDGIDVIWVGLGDVAGSQTPLTPSNLETLRSIWNSVLYAAGVQSVEFASDLPSTTPTTDLNLPYVTPVSILQDASIIVETSAVSFDNPIIFNEEKILFLPDTATFADYDAAADTLGPIAEYMALYPNFRLLLAGTTATAGSNESCKQLSLMRADAVKNLLLDMGVDEKQITQTIGLGYDHKYHIPDIDSNGQQNANAAENRSVILFDANSEEAGALLIA